MNMHILHVCQQLIFMPYPWICTFCMCVNSLFTCLIHEYAHFTCLSTAYLHALSMNMHILHVCQQQLIYMPYPWICTFYMFVNSLFTYLIHEFAHFTCLSTAYLHALSMNTCLIHEYAHFTCLSTAYFYALSMNMHILYVCQQQLIFMPYPWICTFFMCVNSSLFTCLIHEYAHFTRVSTASLHALPMGIHILHVFQQLIYMPHPWI